MTTEVTIIETDNPIFTILTEEAVTDILFVDGAGPRGDSAYQVWLDLDNTGTAQDFIDSLEGDKGDSAYTVWLNAGNTGTETDFLESLRGIDGDPGNSAYQVALDSGFVGTEEQWLLSLKGDKGDSGDIIRKDPEFTYDTEGNLTNIDYPDGSFKEFTYIAGVLTSITYELGAASGTRTFVYTGDVLERIEDE